VLAGQPQYARVDLAPDDAIGIDLVVLGSEHGDLVDVLLQALVAVQAVHVVEEPLAALLGCQRPWVRQGQRERERRQTGCA
jgi:hypothetical protein